MAAAIFMGGSPLSLPDAYMTSVASHKCDKCRLLPIFLVNGASLESIGTRIRDGRTPVIPTRSVRPAPFHHGDFQDAMSCSLSLLAHAETISGFKQKAFSQFIYKVVIVETEDKNGKNLE
jgi:hypothetical protein